MISIILVVHVVLALGLIALVLMQQGKGAEAGAAFGGGSSQTMFGSRGSASFFGKLTGWLAAGFFLTSLGMAWYAAHEYAPDSGVPDAELIEEHNRALPNLDDTDESAPSADQNNAGGAVDSPIALPNESASPANANDADDGAERAGASEAQVPASEGELPALEADDATDSSATDTPAVDTPANEATDTERDAMQNEAAPQ